MADVRSLLRQQRAARRIAHPHAAYSDAGKLLCTVCHEPVKAESLWDGHIRSTGHLQRLHKLQGSESDPALARGPVSHKRKHNNDDPDDLAIADEDEDGMRKKRSRQDISDADARDSEYEQAPQVANVDSNGSKEAQSKVRDDVVATTPTRTNNLTPPLLRRASGTPSHGVEMQIPSRPATPVAVRSEAVGANANASALNRSPVRQRDAAAVAGFVEGTSNTVDRSTFVMAGTPAPANTAPAVAAERQAGDSQGVNEDVWAAFEADLLQSNTAASARAAITAPADAVISAPAMTAEEVAALSTEEERVRRRAAADVELEDEKEEATRALETEFEEMEELEARVRRLKERREALRHQQESPLGTTREGPAKAKPGIAAGSGDKENSDEMAGRGVGGSEDVEEDDDDDDDDDEDADDWAGFHFRG